MKSIFKKLLKPLIIRSVPNGIIIWKNSTCTERSVALTFDDGPDVKYTENILEILHQNNVQATFFLVGKKIEKYPDLAAHIKNEGHEIGNHSYSHNNYSKSKLRNVKSEIDDTQDIIRRYLGFDAVLFRPPYGIISIKMIIHCIRKGLTISMWSVDTRDHEVGSANELQKKIESNVIESGDIILMHDNNKYTLKILPDIIKNLKEKNFEFVKVNELI